MIPFSQLLVAAGGRSDPGVAFGREGAREERHLRADVASLATRLAPAAGGRVLLHCEDAYAFAVGLLASAQVGACAVLPPSRQPGALRRLAPEVAAAILDGSGDPGTLGDRPCLHPLEPPAAEAGRAAAWRFGALDRDAPLVEIFTSGTTGVGKPVAKAVRHLEDEVAVLEARFGGILGAGTRILATTAPQHLYGLLFRVLWPLSAGRPFLRSPLLHLRELAPHLEADIPFALAATPVPLRLLAERGGPVPRADACRAIFSSGGPLAASVATRLAEMIGEPPWEVYGSTETGGVAVRQQRAGGEPWHTLPGVEVAPDPESEGLAVTSPFVSGGEPRPDGRARRVLADRAQFDARGSFRLLGRADRVAKIGDKRLSLPAMEQRLVEHAAVAEAALVALEQGAEARVAAVVVPTPAGRELVEAGGRRALAKVLGEHLAADFDRVLLPRAWRVMAALPRDAQGKTSAEALRALFAAADPAPRAPEVLSVRRAGRQLEAHLRIPEDLAFLDGHFPSLPIVPGVVQVHFVMGALEEVLDAAPALGGLEALKFREILRPGQEVRLRLRVAEDGTRFDFELADAADPQRVFSSGRGWRRFRS